MVTNELDVLATPTLDKILLFEDHIKKMEQLDIPVTHMFAPRVYSRMITIPAGGVVTGEIHREAHLNILVKGSIRIWMNGETRDMHAPLMFVAPAGTKKVGYAFTDTTWITVHGTTETDIDKIKQEMIIPRDEYLKGVESQCLSLPQEP